MTGRSSEVLQLQAKAERARILDARPDFDLDTARLDELSRWSALDATPADVGRALAAERRQGWDLAALLSPVALERLEDLASAAHALTVQRFGRTMHLFAPLYLSNDCVSECTYCGFQVFNRDIVRRTLTPEQVEREVRYLRSLGMRHVLLVAAEHPKYVGREYIEACIEVAARHMPHVSVEVQVFDKPTYDGFVDAGCDGVVVYQEVYDPRLYERFHLKGNKRFWAWRMGAPERAGAAGVRRIGIGTLLGLNPDWRFEVLALAEHARYLMRRYWRAEIAVALPRLEPAAGLENPPVVLSDAEFVQAVAALRLMLPDAGIVLSTREPSSLRDGMLRLGVTHMSAGSRTEPGGYHEPGRAQEQFQIHDRRSVDEVAHAVVAAGYDPVWKEASPVFRRGGAPSDDRL